MNIAAHWKVFERSGSEIDQIESRLYEISGACITRTDIPNYDRTYDAIYVLKGSVDAEQLADACDFMDDIGAYPV